ncbi:MAG TPA: hypothetical protein VNV87_10435, partial [Acidimicrobiales bacterium]|nr:hypothetical protein [Acidimicrobiales bacterium]
MSAEGTDTGQTAERRRAAERRARAIDVRARRASMQVAPEEPAPLPVVLPRNYRPDLDEGEPVDPRRGDVDEWGRSEHVRSLVRRLYDPMYKHWFRVEWEGMEKIPTVGGALLIGNHAGAIPSDAPAIMHGIER